MEYNFEMSQVVPHAEAATTLKNLGRRLSNVTGFDECIAALQKGEAASFEGVPRSACALLVSELSRHCKTSLVVVTPDMDLVGDLHREVKLYSKQRVVDFPHFDFDQNRPLVDQEFGQRIGLLKEMLVGSAPQNRCCRNPKAYSPLALPRKRFNRIQGRSEWGETVDVDALLRWLAG